MLQCAADGLGIPSWLGSGTLDGWVYGQDILPWDIDIDLRCTACIVVFSAAYGALAQKLQSAVLPSDFDNFVRLLLSILWNFPGFSQTALRLFSCRLMTTDLAWLWDTHDGQVVPLDPDGRYLLRVNKHFILPSPLKNNVIDARVVSTSTGEPLGISQSGVLWKRLSCTSASQHLLLQLLSGTVVLRPQPGVSQVSHALLCCRSVH